MTIAMNDIPDLLRVPLTYVEFDNSRAISATPDMPYKLMVFGSKLASTPAEALVPVRVLSADHAEQLFGVGSMLAAMFRGLKGADRLVETWAIPLDDAAAGVKATGSVTIGLAGTPALASGQLALYVGGQRIAVAVSATDTAAAVATRLAAAINNEARLPVTAAVNGGTPSKVDITARHKGAFGNDIDLRVNYRPEDALPIGLTATVVAMASGAGNPDITPALAALGDEWWNQVVMPYNDSTNLSLLRDELAGRWGPTRMVDSMAVLAYRGTHAQTSTFATQWNSQLFTVMGTGISPTAPWVWAAVNAVVMARSLSIDPARPLQTLIMQGVLPPSVGVRWNLEERNLLLFDGVSTFSVDAGGLVRIERQITTYRVNSYGLPDPSYLDVTTPATLSYLRYSLRARIQQKFPRHKLADDGTNYGPGQPIVTPAIIRIELLSLFAEWQEAGLVEDFEQFKHELIVERDANNRNRVNVLMGPNLMNQFNILAAQIQFVL